MSLTITEAWVRERVQLTHDNLDDVRSLSLPGTYQEKVANLGNALSSFTRLKQLDLSRNALQSLQGLQYLTLLEKLNLYYNNIGSLQELSRLRHNPTLQELDLRLNPVTKNEPDYRLYLVHMLPNLRKLDDRSVRESERKSALLHFDTDQATGLIEHAPSPARDGGRREIPRTKHVRGLAARTVVEEDDSDLLDLLSRTDGDLSKPRPITGSAVGNPTVDILTAQDYQRPYGQSAVVQARPSSVTTSHHTEREQSLYQAEPPLHSPDRERSLSRGHSRSRVDNDGGRADSNLRFTDESDAYTAYSSKVNFTPNPKSSEREDSLSSSSYDMHPSGGAADAYSEPPPVQRVAKQNAVTTSGIDQTTFMDSLLNLVDRYWNGSRSLHLHSKFQAQAQSLVEKLVSDNSAASQGHADRLQLDVARYAQENAALRNTLGPVGKAHGPAYGGPELQNALEKAQKDVEILRRDLQDAMAQNRELQTQLVDSRSKAVDAHSGSRGDAAGSAERLQQDNDKLRLQLKHFSQLQELASMLQESHKSLVTTNDHLLKELEEVKQRHLEEVKQLHWSYNQLRQTMDIVHPSQALATGSNYGARPGGGAEGSGPGPGYSPGRKVKGFGYSNGTL